MDYNLKCSTSRWQAAVTKCHFKWWRIRMWSLPLYTDVWDLGNFRLRKMKGESVTWAVAQCSLIVTDRGPWGACCLHLQSWWRQKISLTHWYCCTRLHSVTHQKTVIFRRMSGPTRCISSLHDAHHPQSTFNKGVCHVKLHFVLLVNFKSVYHLVCL